MTAGDNVQYTSSILWEHSEAYLLPDRCWMYICDLYLGLCEMKTDHIIPSKRACANKLTKKGIGKSGAVLHQKVCMIVHNCCMQHAVSKSLIAAQILKTMYDSSWLFSVENVFIHWFCCFSF
jgi:hypothetical protein